MLLVSDPVKRDAFDFRSDSSCDYNFSFFYQFHCSMEFPFTLCISWNSLVYQSLYISYEVKDFLCYLNSLVLIWLTPNDGLQSFDLWSRTLFTAMHNVKTRPARIQLWIELDNKEPVSSFSSLDSEIWLELFVRRDPEHKPQLIAMQAVMTIKTPPRVSVS